MPSDSVLEFCKTIDNLFYAVYSKKHGEMKFSSSSLSRPVRNKSVLDSPDTILPLFPDARHKITTDFGKTNVWASQYLLYGVVRRSQSASFPWRYLSSRVRTRDLRLSKPP